MNWLSNLFGVGSATAATGTTAAQHSTSGALMSMLPMMIIFVAVFYFLIIRPQQKRQQEQKKMMDNLSIGDDVLTSGGLLGRVSKLRDNYLVVKIAKEVEVTIQRNAVASILPKGTFKLGD